MDRDTIDYEIGPARPEDFEAVGELTVAAYAVLGEDLGDYADELRDVATHARQGEVYVARIRGQVVGGVTLVAEGGPLDEWSDPDAVGIRFLAVAPQARGRGIATALMRVCIRRAQELGRARVLLDTTDVMAAAQRLYVGLGFEREESGDWEPEPGLWLRRYRLQLGDSQG